MTGARTRTGAPPRAMTRVAVPPRQAVPPVSERGPLSFAPQEKVAAFVVGALVWVALAYGTKDAIFRAAFGSLGGSPFAGGVASRLASLCGLHGFLGPMAFSASVGAAFLARSVSRCKRGAASVRGLGRGADLLLSLPLFQVLSVACFLNKASNTAWGEGLGTVGLMAWLATSIFSLLGGAWVLCSAEGCSNEGKAHRAVPLLWAWQVFCFTPWSCVLLGVLID